MSGSSSELLPQLAGDVSGRRQRVVDSFDEHGDGLTKLPEFLPKNRQSVRSENDSEIDNEKAGGGERERDPEKAEGRKP